MNRSVFGSINVRDLLHGLLLASGTAAGVVLMPIIQTGFPTVANLETAAGAGLSAGVAYLIKQFVSNEGGNFGQLVINKTGV